MDDNREKLRNDALWFTMGLKNRCSGMKASEKIGYIEVWPGSRVFLCMKNDLVLKKRRKIIFITVLKQGYGCPGIEQTSPAAFYL